MTADETASKTQSASGAVPGPILRTLLVLAFPIVVSMASRTAMHAIDFVMVSQLGQAAQAALVPAGLLLFCAIAFGFGMASVVSTLSSQALGRGATDQCGVWAWQGLWWSLAWGALVLCALPWVEPGVLRLGHDPEMARLEVDYIRVGLWGVAPTVASAVLIAFFQGIHRPWAGLWATVLSNVFNVVANYALIYGQWGFPAMGVAGASLATVLASVVSLGVLLVFLRRPVIWTTFGLGGTWRPRRKPLATVVRLGGPAGLQATADLVCFSIFLAVLVGRFGVPAMAGSNIAFKYFELAIVPVIGLAMATTAAVGRCLGAGDGARARATASYAWALGAGWTGLVGVGYVLLGPTLVGWLTDDPEVQRQGVAVLACMAVFQVFDAAKYILGGALRGAGDTAWPAVALLGSFLVVMLGGGWAVVAYAPGLGVVGPWLAATTAFGLVTGLFAWRFYARHRAGPEAGFAGP
ncbi:MAG: MATE family efflux transporter [Planctomycetota bacterium]